MKACGLLYDCGEDIPPGGDSHGSGWRKTGGYWAAKLHVPKGLIPSPYDGIGEMRLAISGHENSTQYRECQGIRYHRVSLGKFLGSLAAWNTHSALF